MIMFLEWILLNNTFMNRVPSLWQKMFLKVIMVQYLHMDKQVKILKVIEINQIEFQLGMDPFLSS